MTRYRLRARYPIIDDTPGDPEAVELTQDQAQAFAYALAAMKPGDPQPVGLERPYSITVAGTPYLPNDRFVDPAMVERAGGIARSHVARPYTRTGKPRGAGSHRPPVDPGPADDATWELLLSAREAAADGNDLTPGGVAAYFTGPPTSAAGLRRAMGGRSGLRRFLKDGTRPGNPRTI